MTLTTTPLAGPGSPRPAARVTQAVLREYEALAASARRLRVLRQHLVEALATGAAVESGVLTARLKARQCRRFTLGGVSVAIGDGPARDLLNRIEPKTSQSLEVGRSPR